MAGYVTRGARVGVVEPGAADVRAPLENRQVGEPVLLQLDRRGQTSEAAADDHDAGLGGLGHVRKPIADRAADFAQPRARGLLEVSFSPTAPRDMVRR